MRIYLSAPDVGSLEEQYVVRALRSGWIAPLGPDVDAFEEEMAGRIGRDHAVALSSGTAALHLGLLCLGVGPGSVVVTSTLTFAATVNAIIYTGATPYFVDCLPETGNMDPSLLEEALEDLDRRSVKVAAIIPVDLLGKCADHSQIGEIAGRRGIPLLVDAAESLGASHAGRPAGSFGEAAIFSFNGNKIMTTSGGGMLLTDNPGIAQRVRYLATQARQPVAHYEHEDVGYNYRMSNLLAALGRAQLSRLDAMIARRRQIRALYAEAFARVGGVAIMGGESQEDNFWLTSIVVDPAGAGWRAGELSAVLGAADIESRPVWKPMHAQPVFQRFPATLNGSADRLFEQGLTLPSGSALTDHDMAFILSVISEFVGERAGVDREMVRPGSAPAPLVRAALRDSREGAEFS